MDELLQEVEKELHTRFKNMFEGNMLLPNLDFNPDFDGKDEANLLNLEEAAANKKESAKKNPEDMLLSLAQGNQQYLDYYGQIPNWLRPRPSPWLIQRNDYEEELYGRENSVDSAPYFVVEQEEDHVGYGGYIPTYEAADPYYHHQYLQ